MRTKRTIAAMEALETRALMAASPLPDGVDRIGLGDFNGDRVADIAVSGRQNGSRLISIYSEDPTATAGPSTGAGGPASTAKSAPVLLASIPNPFAGYNGVLEMAVGDYDGDGLSDLAVTKAVARGKLQIQIYSFVLTNPNASPIGATVNAVPWADSAEPSLSGIPKNSGVRLTSAYNDSTGQYTLFIQPIGPQAAGCEVWNFSTSSRIWTESTTVTLSTTTRILTVSAGDIDGNGTIDLAAGLANGSVVLMKNATASNATTSRYTPYGRSYRREIGLSMVSSESGPGGLIVVPTTTAKKVKLPTPMFMAEGSLNRPTSFRPSVSPGNGLLVTASGGWHYPASRNQTVDGFSLNDGPVTPVVLMASRLGTSVTVQGFVPGSTTGSLKASSADTVSEPVLAAASAPGAKFSTLNVVFPTLKYNSPYSLNLTYSTESLGHGLWPLTPNDSQTGFPWGPQHSYQQLNTAPTPPAGEATDWLRQRVLFAASQFLGYDYQHHHEPTWNPAQGTKWNAVEIGYNSPGADCSNFQGYINNSALGVYTTGAIEALAAIGIDPTTGASTAITPGQNINWDVSDKNIKPQTILMPKGVTYDQLVGANGQTAILQPGDLLLINPSKGFHTGDQSDPSNVTHVIRYLGKDGKDANGEDQYLILDSTGNAPFHVDSDNHVIKPGVQIRPFSDYGDVINSWYSNHVDHVLRLIAEPEAE